MTGDWSMLEEVGTLCQIRIVTIRDSGYWTRQGDSGRRQGPRATRALRIHSASVSASRDQLQDHRRACSGRIASYLEACGMMDRIFAPHRDIAAAVKMSAVGWPHPRLLRRGPVQCVVRSNRSDGAGRCLSGLSCGRSCSFRPHATCASGRNDERD
jgi:hypothetical protein